VLITLLLLEVVEVAAGQLLMAAAVVEAQEVFLLVQA
jgi:hypothetical protein